MSVKRSVGYCENSKCAVRLKRVFLLSREDAFLCPRCKEVGCIEREIGYDVGNSDIFKEVRVEYDFDPASKEYRAVAIVRDDSLTERYSGYTLRSPIIKTELRALRVAESILANLNRHGRPGLEEVPGTTEITLSFDVDFEVLSRRLRRLGEEWEASGLAAT